MWTDKLFSQQKGRKVGTDITGPVKQGNGR